jgi:hypothetical protein
MEFEKIEIPGDSKFSGGKSPYREYEASDIRGEIEELRESEESLKANFDSLSKSGELTGEDINAFKKAYDDEEWKTEKDNRFKNYCIRVEKAVENKYSQNRDEQSNNPRWKFKEALMNYLVIRGLEEKSRIKKEARKKETIH